MSQLKANTTATIERYVYNFLAGCDRTSVINIVTTRLIDSVRVHEVRGQEDRNLAVELVLRILEYNITFADFFKDLEREAGEQKEQLHSQLSTPQMTAATRRSQSMRLLKQTRKGSRQIGLHIVEFVKLCLTNNREEITAFVAEENINMFLDADMQSDLSALIQREDVLYIHLSRDRYYTHRDR